MKTLLIPLAATVMVALAGSSAGYQYAGLSLFGLCALFIFAVQWLVFVPSFLAQTERFYDLTGSVTYLAVVWLAIALQRDSDPRGWILVFCVSAWALRLGAFLFARISRDGADSRFDRIKPSAARFFFVWNLQASWVLVTVGCALAAILGEKTVALGPFDFIGLGLWSAGFAIECIADWQKRAFRRIHGSDGFITTGLWSRSQHPNYFGEILLWTGVAILAFPALQGYQFITLVSPLYVYWLLTRVSGIPMLANKSRRRWGHDPAYRAYVKDTPLLVPRLF